MNLEWGKHRDAAAKERSHLRQVQRIRQRTRPGPLNSNAIGETAGTPDNGSLPGCAQVLLPGKAFVTGQAAVSKPADSDALADFESFGRFTQGGNGPGHLVSRDERVLG